MTFHNYIVFHNYITPTYTHKNTPKYLLSLGIGIINLLMFLFVLLIFKSLHDKYVLFL